MTSLRKIDRHSEAVARQQTRDFRSVSEQILLLRSRPGQSAREIARLTKLL